nr:sugar ABC transporter permease [Clostridiales bacterium]
MARKYSPDRWSLKDGFGAFIPWSSTYHSMRARNARTGVRFILPFIIGFLLFMLMPLIQSLQFSLSNVKLVPGEGYSLVWNNFLNYKDAVSIDATFNKAIVDESGKMVINTIATLVLSLVLAVILNQKFRGRTLARAIFFLPVILSSGVLAGVEQTSASSFNIMTAVSQEAASASGVNLSQSLQDLLSVSGVGSGAFKIVFDMIDAIYDIVMASGIQIIVFLSGLSAISPSLYEAAEVEGCTAWEAF